MTFEVRVQCRCYDGATDKHHFIQRIISLPFAPFDGLFIADLLMKGCKSKIANIHWFPIMANYMNFGYFVCSLLGGTNESEVASHVEGWQKINESEYCKAIGFGTQDDY